MIPRLKYLNKDFDFTKIDPTNYYKKINSILSTYTENHELIKPVKPSYKLQEDRDSKKVKSKSEDIVYGFLITEGIRVKLTDILKELPELNNYSAPVDSARNLMLHDGKVEIKFYGFQKAKAGIVAKYDKFLAEKGRANKKLNCYEGGVSAVYKTIILGNLANIPENDEMINGMSREKFIETAYIEIPISKDIFKAIKAYFLTIANAPVMNKDVASINFSDFCSEKEYLDKFITTSLAKELTDSELSLYRSLLSLKYRYIKEYVIKACQYLLDLVPKALSTINESNQNFLNSKTDSLIITTSYGLNYLVRQSLSSLKLYNLMTQFFEQAHLEFIEDSAVQVIRGMLNTKVTCPEIACKQFRMSPYTNLSKTFYNYAKSTNAYKKYFDNRSGINVAVRRSSDQVLQNVRRSFNHQLLSDAINNEETVILYLDSTLIESTAKFIDNCGLTFSKTHGYTNCYKLTVLQLANTKAPIVFESGDAIVPDVKTLPDLLQSLNRLGLNNKNLLICGDKGYFSEENLATLESLDFKYCLMAKDVKAIIDSGKQFRLGEWVKGYNKEYQLNTILNTITYSDYLNPNKAYVPTLERKIQEHKPEFSLSDIANRKINILHTLSSKDLKHSFEYICNRTYDFYNEYKDIISTEKELKATKEKAKKYFYINDNQLDYNYDVIEQDLPTKALFSIVSNDLSMSTIDLIKTYKERMYIESTFAHIKSFQDMNSFCKHLNETADLKNFVNWIVVSVRNNLEYLLNTPITGDSPRDKAREKSRLYLLKETKGSVDSLLYMAINSFKVSFIGRNTKPSYTSLNKHGSAIVDLLGDNVPPDIYKNTGFIESSTRITSKIKNKDNIKSIDLSNIDIDEYLNIIIKDSVIDY